MTRFNVRLSALLAVVASAAVVAAGCGGGDDDVSSASGANKASGTSSLSRAEFMKRANTACKELRAGLNKRLATFERIQRGRPEPFADAVHFVLLPMIEEQISTIQLLSPPVGDKDRIDAMLDLDRTAVDAVAVMPRVASLAAARRHFTRVARRFQAYGLPACANGSTQEGKNA